MYDRTASAALDLRTPKTTRCRSFYPRFEHFRANPADFVSAARIIRTATFFDIQGVELRKIRLMATDAERDKARNDS
jgi:hypothetical protein